MFNIQSFLGFIATIEVKANQKGYQKAIRQIFDAIDRLQEVFSILGLSTEWKHVGIFYAHIGAEMPLFDCDPCSIFAIIGEDQISGTDHLQLSFTGIFQTSLKKFQPSTFSQELQYCASARQVLGKC